MAIPVQGTACGSVSDIRTLAWLKLEELNEAAADGDWDVADIWARILDVAAAILYVEQVGKAETEVLIATMPSAVRECLDRLRRSGLVESAVRVPCVPMRGRGH